MFHESFKESTATQAIYQANVKTFHPATEFPILQICWCAQPVYVNDKAHNTGNLYENNVVLAYRK